MQAWLGEPPIFTTVSPGYVKIKNTAKYWLNVISQISSCTGIKLIYRRLSLARTRGDQAFYNELSVLRGINFMTLRLAKLQNVALHRLLNLL